MNYWKRNAEKALEGRFSFFFDTPAQKAVEEQLKEDERLLKKATIRKAVAKC
jgi:hypothetical protein